MFLKVLFYLSYKTQADNVSNLLLSGYAADIKGFIQNVKTSVIQLRYINTLDMWGYHNV